MYFNNNIYVLLVLYFLNQQIWTVFLRSITLWWGGSNQGQIWKVGLWSMVYLNTIPIRNLSHRIKNRNKENRQPVEPKSVKQQSHQNKTEKKLWGTIVLGGQLSGGAIVLLPWKVCHFPLINRSFAHSWFDFNIMYFFNKSYFPYFRFHTRSKESTKKILIICRHLNLVKKIGELFKSK